ncbi:hypothetical protein [Streptomyces broussonetiae]|uniref:Uncharacterized protein n=1 Tax=Streptomyces broussonetiae TaxID=2686304 RepID=A0ABV5ED42_9ACTN
MHRHRAPGETGGDPVPRDLPDQQHGAGEDHWDVDPRQADPATDDGEPAPEDVSDDVPDTDEAGTGRKGAAHGSTVHPEHPDPDESPA